MNHPNATISNIFTFLWCLWKARNDALFRAKLSLPHHIWTASLATSSCENFQELVQDSCPQGRSNQEAVSRHPMRQGDEQLLQGCTVKSNLAIAGSKVYSDASWHRAHIPGRGDLPATGIGVFIHQQDAHQERQIMIQASAPDAHSPLVTESLGLQLAARIARVLQLHKASFLTDNLALAKMAATRKINDSTIAWRCRPSISSFFQDTHPSHDTIYHIPRNINGIAHNAAHQDLNSRIEPALGCTCSAHRSISCPSLAQLQISIWRAL